MNPWGRSETLQKKQLVLPSSKLRFCQFTSISEVHQWYEFFRLLFSTLKILNSDAFTIVLRISTTSRFYEILLAFRRKWRKFLRINSTIQSTQKSFFVSIEYKLSNLLLLHTADATTELFGIIFIIILNSTLASFRYTFLLRA